MGEDPYAGLTYDEWLERNPIPEKWLARLERDEVEMEAEQRLLPQPATRRAVARAKDKSGGGSAARLVGNSRRGMCTLVAATSMHTTDCLLYTSDAADE